MPKLSEPSVDPEMHYSKRGVGRPSVEESGSCQTLSVNNMQSQRQSFTQASCTSLNSVGYAANVDDSQRVTFIDKEGTSHSFDVAEGSTLLDVARTKNLEIEGCTPSAVSRFARIFFPAWIIFEVIVLTKDMRRCLRWGVRMQHLPRNSDLSLDVYGSRRTRGAGERPTRPCF